MPTSREALQPSGRLQAPRASLALGGGAVWLANGAKRLVRIDAGTGEKATVGAGRRIDAVAAGGGAVWALSSRSASVLRVNPRDGAVTDTVSIAARSGAEAPFPVAIAATSRAVWVLNGNTATVTQIDPRTLGVVTTIPIGVDRVPTDIAATGGTAWISNGDGSLARVGPGRGPLTSCAWASRSNAWQRPAPRCGSRRPRSTRSFREAPDDSRRTDRRALAAVAVLTGAACGEDEDRSANIPRNPGASRQAARR